MNLREAAEQARTALNWAADHIPPQGDPCQCPVCVALVALEAALEQQEQEPYCYVYEYDSAFGLHREFYPGPYNGKQHPDRTVPVYTHPPRREWRGLTEEEINAALPHEPGDLDFVCARAIEQALRSRNEQA